MLLDKKQFFFFFVSFFFCELCIFPGFEEVKVILKCFFWEGIGFGCLLTCQYTHILAEVSASFEFYLSIIGVSFEFLFVFIQVSLGSLLSMFRVLFW